MRKKGILFVVIACISWAFMGVTSRNLYNLGVDAWTIAFFRCAIAGSFYWLLLLKQKPSSLIVKLKDIPFLALYGITALGLGFMTYNLSIQHISIAMATVLMFTNPIWVVILNRIFFNVSISISKVLCIFCVLFGCILIAKAYDPSQLSLNLFGIIMGLVNGLFFALQLVLPKFSKRNHSKDTILSYGFLMGSIFLIFFADFDVIKGLIFNSSQNLYFILNLLVLGIINTFIANSFYVKATDYIDDGTVSLLVALEPILSSIVAFYFFKEVLELAQIIGMIIVIFTISFMEYYSNKKNNDLKFNNKKTA